MKQTVLRLLVFLGMCLTAQAAENLQGLINLIYPGDLTLYGLALDYNGGNAVQVKVCWDDPTLTRNCDSPVTANTSYFPYIGCSGCYGFHYVIPSRTVGSVNPRDGNHHFIYAKILSQANPGAGDKVLDGSGWPFTYRSNAVAQMWQANLESSPTRLTASELAVIANVQDPYSIGSTGGTVCTIGGVPIRNDGVVGYYVQQHNVPCSNVYTVSLPVQIFISEAQFISLVQPTLKSLSASLQAIALGWVEPSAIGYPSPGHYLQSMSGTVAAGGMVSGNHCYVPSQNLLGEGPVNPYFNTASKAPFTDYGIRPTMMLAGEKCPQCTSSNNYTLPWTSDFQAAKRFIDAAIANRDTDPSGGNVDWAWTQDYRRNVAAVQSSSLTLGNALSPFVNAQVLGSYSAPQPSLVSAQNLLMYVQGAANWNYSNLSFLPGAGIGFSVTSNSGLLPYDGNQTNASTWLNAGAVASYGNAIEPCELLPYKHPDPAVAIPNYTQGQTAVEALWKSVRMPWGGNFAGDPLAAPFRLSGGTQPSAPVISSISPATAQPGSSVSIAINGSNFTAGSTVAVGGTGVSVSNPVVVNASQITVVFTSASNAAAGPRNVTVTNAGGTSGAAVFTVGAVAPTLASISPSSGSQGSNQQVTLTGSGFVAGSTVAAGSGVIASNVTVVNAGTLTATLTIASNAPAGTHAVSVSNSAGTSGTVGFTVTVPAGNPAPTINSISPATVIQGASANVTIKGTNFTAGASVSVSGSGVLASNVILLSDTQVQATLAASASAPLGAYAISVSTAAGTSNSAAFNVTGASWPRGWQLLYQAESLASATSGPSLSSLSWGGFPSGVGTFFAAGKPGDFVTFTLNLSRPGRYDVRASLETLNTYGSFQLAVNGVNVGSADEYSAGPARATYDVGVFDAPTAGPVTFRFTVTGKNPLSSGYALSFDYFLLTAQ